MVNLTSSLQDQALEILRQFAGAQADVSGKAVVLTNGVAGTVDEVHLDDLHGLKVKILGHEGLWPISTLKHSESDQG